jgi:recombination protein RecT
MAGQSVVRQDRGGQVAERPETRLKGLLDARADEFGKALAGRVDPQAFVRVAYTTITKSPRLMEATPASVLMALLECASLGLVPNGVMGEAYLVPFNNKVKEDGRERWEVQAQFIPGYRGLVKLARNTGVVRNIVTRPVYEGDVFEVEYGSVERLHHVPDLSAPEEQRRLTHVWAMAHFPDGGQPQFEVMTRADVDAIRRRSKTANNGPWVTDYPEMALKTVVRRVCKRLPASDHDQTLSRALEADNRDYMDVSEVAAAQQRTRLAERFAPPALPAPADFPAPTAAHPDLDAAGLTGDVDAHAVPTPSPDVPLSSSAAGGKLSTLRALVEVTAPSGKAPLAVDEQRATLRRIAMQAIAGADEALADRVLAVAGNAKLSRQQAQDLVNAGFAAAVEMGVDLSTNDAAGDPALPLEG